MSDLNLPLVSGVLAASFLGSWHCAGMCSPIACLMRDQAQLWQYQVGRGISYTLLGAISGGMGMLFLDSEIQSIRRVAEILFFLFLLIYGLRLLWPESFQKLGLANSSMSKSKPMRLLSTFLTQLLHKAVRSGGLTVGLCSAFLPCGWLYSFVVAAAATKSPVLGSAVTFTFFLGTVPALAVIPRIANPLLGQHFSWSRIAGFILVMTAFYSLAVFIVLGES